MHSLIFDNFEEGFVLAKVDELYWTDLGRKIFEITSKSDGSIEIVLTNRWRGNGTVWLRQMEKEVFKYYKLSI